MTTTYFVKRNVTPEEAVRKGLAAVKCPACSGPGTGCVNCNGAGRIVVQVRRR